MINFNRTMLFDGSYMLHRALSQPELWDMKNSNGQKTGGIFGCLKTIVKELKDYNYFPIIVFDGGLSKRRLNIYPNYKRAQEKEMLLECKEDEKTEQQLLDEEFRREYNTQRNILIKLLPLFGIPVIYSPDWEGDDLLYILSKMSKDSIVVSDDKDLIQLLYFAERRCRIRRPLKNELLDQTYLETNNINVDDFVGCKCIIGDPSDNIPSACFQVGEKTALGLYKIYKESLITNNFPTNEEQLNLICKKLNIPKRKAYLNFNETQFLTNMSLTDLKLVDDEINNDLINNLYNSIVNQYNYNNKVEILQTLHSLDIKSFEVDNLFNKINYLKPLLTMDNIETSYNIKETNIHKGLFDL